jgi:hypothetical protein
VIEDSVIRKIVGLGTESCFTDKYLALLLVNGDDAFACFTGAENVVVKNALISGPGCHGTSIGSLGQVSILCCGYGAFG